jgi:hypothetical protein
VLNLKNDVRIAADLRGRCDAENARENIVMNDIKSTFTLARGISASSRSQQLIDSDDFSRGFDGFVNSPQECHGIRVRAGHVMNARSFRRERRNKQHQYPQSHHAPHWRYSSCAAVD